MKYFTAFIFEETSKALPVHCTHKFLGKLGTEDLNRAVAIVDRFFQSYRHFPQVIFDEPKFFGPDKTIRVLTPSTFKAVDFFPQLRDLLRELKPDDYPEYNPHVSTHLPVWKHPITHYALMTGDKILRTWPTGRRS